MSVNVAEICPVCKKDLDEHDNAQILTCIKIELEGLEKRKKDARARYTATASNAFQVSGEAQY